MKNHFSKTRSSTVADCLQRGLYVIVISMAFFLPGLAGAEELGNVCTKTSAGVLKSCRSSAEADYLLAKARCDNSPADSGCLQQALANKNETLRDCKDQFDVRKDACGPLGPAAYDPEIDPANFTTKIDNPLFPLKPGTTFIYEGQTSQGLEHDEFIVTHKTRVIMGVTCVEVRDRVRLDGKLAEDTLDWFAQDLDGNVWYFGENTHELENGLITTIDGSFVAGVEGAKPGIVMEAHPRVSDFYRQEFDLGNAEDFAKVTGLNASVTVPFGSFTNCLKTRETTPLEPDLLEDKLYCPGIGNVETIDRVTGETVSLLAIQ